MTQLVNEDAEPAAQQHYRASRTGLEYNKVVMRIVFLGTAEFACPALEQLIAHAGIEVLALITQPDKPVGRKQIITPPATKVIAAKHRIKVYQPEKISQDLVLLEELRTLKPDFLVTAAYGQILKQNVLDIAPVLNLHASLLPKFRGAAPINWMIIHGEHEVGVSTTLSDTGIDTGAILLKSATTLGDNENAQELTQRLALIGAELLVKTLEGGASITPIVQDASVVPAGQLLAPFMDRKLGAIDFLTTALLLGSANPRQADFKIQLANNAGNIHNLVRGTYPWPGAYFIYDGKKITMLETALINDASNLQWVDLVVPNGLLRYARNGAAIVVRCYDGSLLRLIKLKPEGKAEMTAGAWVNGLATR